MRGTKSRQGKNRPITRVRAYDNLRAAAHHCDLTEIGTHTLRKTFGYLVYQNDKDVALLQDIFNHSAPYPIFRGVSKRYFLRKKAQNTD